MAEEQLPPEQQAAMLRQLLLEATQRLALYENPGQELGGSHVMTLIVTTRGVYPTFAPYLHALEPIDQRSLLLESARYLTELTELFEVTAGQGGEEDQP